MPAAFASPRPADRADAPPVADRRADPARQHGSGRPAEAPDPLALVRDHVVPKLVDLGLLGAGEDPDVSDAAGLRPPSVPGAAGRHGVQLRVGSTSTSEVSRLDRTAPGDRTDGPARAPVVHVHIDRIEVIRPPAPPSPRPPAAPRSAPFASHTAYLARRRGHG